MRSSMRCYTPTVSEERTNALRQAIRDAYRDAVSTHGHDAIDALSGGDAPPYYESTTRLMKSSLAHIPVHERDTQGAT